MDADERARQVETMLAHPRYRDDKAIRERIEAALRKAGYLVAAARPPSAIPDDADALLTRAQTAAALTAAGYPVTESTLNTKATRGGGPPYHHFGPRVLYRWSTSLKWAKDRLSKPMSSTSELRAAPR